MIFSPVNERCRRMIGSMDQRTTEGRSRRKESKKEGIYSGWMGGWSDEQTNEWIEGRRRSRQEVMTSMTQPWTLKQQQDTDRFFNPFSYVDVSESWHSTIFYNDPPNQRSVNLQPAAIRHGNATTLLTSDTCPYSVSYTHLTLPTIRRV